MDDQANDRAFMLISGFRRKAMKPDARLLLIEQIVPARAEDSALSRRLFMTDVQMLVMLAGRERTEDEYRDLLHGAGLRLTPVITTESRFQLIEAVPLQADTVGRRPSSQPSQPAQALASSEPSPTRADPMASGRGKPASRNARLAKPRK